MTNGEKLVKVFPDIELYKKMHGGIQIDFDSTWWNAEYKEPSTKINQDFNQDLTKIAVEEFANKILNAMDFSIKVTDSKDAYGVGMRNGIRYCKSLIDNKEPEFENVPEKVERQIKEICISYPKSNLKEHDGQPYYSVKYIENGEEYQGYGTYKIEVLMEYLRNYFMPPVTPQLSSGTRKNSQKLENASPIIDWNKCHTSEQLDCISTTKNNLAVDCIDRAELLKAMDTWDKFGFEHTGCFVREPKDDYVTYVHYEDMVKCVKGMSSVTPIRPKGHWIPIYQGDEIIGYRCSECEFGNTFGKGTIGMNFCSNCGADMREVEE